MALHRQQLNSWTAFWKPTLNDEYSELKEALRLLHCTVVMIRDIDRALQTESSESAALRKKKNLFPNQTLLQT